MSAVAASYRRVGASRHSRRGEIWADEKREEKLKKVVQERQKERIPLYLMPLWFYRLF